MAAYFQTNELGIKRTGVFTSVPSNNVARLMYYLQCVCTAVECEEDSDIQRFTNYRNWSNLSFDEQKVLLALCYTFSPDVLDDKVFFHSDALCGDSMNEFFEISQVRHQLFAAESIIIAGRTREVNKIMTYKMAWMRTYYVDPMQGLVARLRSVSERPAITYTRESRRTYSSDSSEPLMDEPTTSRDGYSAMCICCSFCCCLIVLAMIMTTVLVIVLKK
jgi:hypothetical protein